MLTKKTTVEKLDISMVPKGSRGGSRWYELSLGAGAGKKGALGVKGGSLGGRGLGMRVRVGVAER